MTTGFQIHFKFTNFTGETMSYKVWSNTQYGKIFVITRKVIQKVYVWFHLRLIDRFTDRQVFLNF